MICDHISITERKTGARGTCSKCQKPIIWNGTKWIWEHEMGMDKVRRMHMLYRTAKLTKPEHCCPPHRTSECRDDCDGMCECC